jgi:NitT/TauT family transport system substrate-binding protein
VLLLLLGEAGTSGRTTNMFRISLSALRIGTIGFGVLASAIGAHANDAVRVVMSWLPDPQHGGYYQAAATGIYAKHGLDVTILPGGPQINSQLMLASGQVDFRVASSSASGFNYVEQNIPVMVIAASFQKEPSILLSHPGVDTLPAMKGKPIELGQQSVDTWWRFLVAKYGFADSQIRPYTFSLAPFLADKNMVQQGYVTSEPYLIERQAGFKPNVFMVADVADYNSYAQTLEAAAATVNGKADVVQRFVDATIEGWYSYLYGDPTPANVMIKRENPENTDLDIANSIAAMKERGLVDSGDTTSLGIGAMTDARWKSFFETASRLGIYPTSLDYTKAYTLRFVNHKHGLEMRK